MGVDFIHEYLFEISPHILQRKTHPALLLPDDAFPFLLLSFPESAIDPSRARKKKLSIRKSTALGILVCISNISY